jgi:multimeric flavodoxin WrbA
MINGSHRMGGNTEVLLKIMEEEFEKCQIDWDLLSLAGLSVEHCKVCDHCAGAPECGIHDDFDAILKKVIATDALIIGSPVYVGAPSSKVMTFIQRLTYLSHSKHHLLKDKVGGAVIVAGEAGHLTALNILVDVFLVNGMTVLGSQYWPIGTASAKGGITGHASAIENIRHLSQKIVRHLQKTGAK